MVVLCLNPDCGAVLRVAVRAGPTQAVLEQDGLGSYLQCPRCSLRTRVDGRAGAPEAPAERGGGQPSL
jgi:hypothetical protein